MKFFYNVAYFVFAIFYLPIFVIKIRQADNPRLLIAQRLGKINEEWLDRLAVNNTIWIHAVSVGEVMAVEKIIREFLERNITAVVVLTTVTPTGQAIAKKIQADRLYTAYFPFDFSICVRSFFEKIKPRCFLLVETELWPNAVLEAIRMGVPVGILNGRLSKRSAQRYSFFSFLFRELFSKINFVWAQTAEDAERFQRVGFVKERIKTLGNIKYDELSSSLQKSDRAERIMKIYKNGNRKILIAGSTHLKEEEIIAHSFSRLKSTFRDWLLVIVPRHIERSEAIRKEIQSLGLSVAMSHDQNNDAELSVLIVNELGVLKNLYEYADLIFIGGSLAKRGGQNPIEALRFKKAIIFGPHVFNFSETYSRINGQKGGVQLQHQDEIDQVLCYLMENESERAQFGQRGYESLLSLCGATQKHLDALEAELYQPSESMKG